MPFISYILSICSFISQFMQMHLMYILRHFVLFQHLIIFSGWLHMKYLVFFMLIIIGKH